MIKRILLHSIIKPGALLLLILVALQSCVVKRELGVHTKVENKEVSNQVIVDTSFRSSLYKLGMHWSDKYFSSLMYFKKMEKDSSIRIVMLSEMGLNLMDFEYKNGNFELKSCQEVLNRPLLLRLMKRDLELVLHEAVFTQETKKYQARNSNNYLLIDKSRSGKYYYFYDDTKNIRKLVKRKRPIGKTVVNFLENQEGTPKKFEIVHGKKLKLSFNLLKREE